MKILLQAIKSLMRNFEAKLTKKTENLLTSKLDVHNPTATGSFSLGRKEGSEVGDNSIAVGNEVVASGNWSCALGRRSEARGGWSFAMGWPAMAYGDVSCAWGTYTVANSHSQFVLGEYNILDEVGLSLPRGKYVFIIGNGNSPSARSNAHTLDWYGNAWYAGTVEGTALILSSPNGTRFKVTVDDNGTLSATAITE